MEYNSQREHLVIPEYGRNIQKMVDHACTIENKEDRTKTAAAIVKIMAQLNAQTKNLEEFQQKIWNHLFIISDFKLDVDSPFPIPSKDSVRKKPSKLNYNGNPVKYKHYGTAIEGFIRKAKALPVGEEKDQFVGVIANLMKQMYLTWNRDSVNNETILKHLKEMSNGELNVSESFEFKGTGELLSSAPKNNNNNHHKQRKNNNQGRHKQRRRKY